MVLNSITSDHPPRKQQRKRRVLACDHDEHLSPESSILQARSQLEVGAFPYVSRAHLLRAPRPSTLDLCRSRSTSCPFALGGRLRAHVACVTCGSCVSSLVAVWCVGHGGRPSAPHSKAAAEPHAAEERRRDNVKRSLRLRGTRPQ